MFYAFLSCISLQMVDFPPIEVSGQIRPQQCRPYAPCPGPARMACYGGSLCAFSAPTWSPIPRQTRHAFHAQHLGEEALCHRFAEQAFAVGAEG